MTGIFRVIMGVYHGMILIGDTDQHMVIMWYHTRWLCCVILLGTW